MQIHIEEAVAEGIDLMTEVLSLYDFQYIRDFIKEKSAISLDESKGYLIEARLCPLIERYKKSSIAEIIDCIRADPNGPIADSVINAIIIHETSFFRDIHPQEALQFEIIPKIIDARKNQKTLRIWCGACSSGQEPYSIAMLLKEHFSEPLKDWDVNILATDISTDIINQARKGLFNQIEMNRGLPLPYLVKYFKKAGLKWKINDEIQSMINFRSMNLIKNWIPMHPMDIVLLRNVLIYFDIETKQKILCNLVNVMQSQSYLFLGSTEALVNLNVPFTRIQSTRSFYYTPKASTGA